MAHLETAAPRPKWLRPWPLTIYGIAAAIVSASLAWFETPGLIPYMVILAAASLILPGLAIYQRLRKGVTDQEDRTEPTCLLGVAALVAFIASKSLDPWDSGAMLARVLGAVALLGACLVALPALPRKILASLIILFHFGGILTAVTSVPPPGSQPPWLAVQAWGNVYHPYLQFMYLNNAYHFYSPEPGPPTLLWFRVKYKSGRSRWVKIPSRMASPIPMHYMREVAMSETFNDMAPVSVEEFERIRRERQGGEPLWGIPVHPGMPLNGQYQQLSEYSRMLGSSYVRHVARTSPSPDNPDDPVVLVKFYRVTHRILSPDEYARGLSPTDKTTYLPFFCGDFDADGKLLNPTDPLLYWLIPIFREGIGTRQSELVHNYFKVHSGDDITP